MPQNFNFNTPTSIAFGAGRVAKLGADVARLGGDGATVLLVSDPGVADAGLTGQIQGILEAADLTVVSFTDVKSDPLATSADEAAALARSRGASVVVGLGGGSSA